MRGTRVSESAHLGILRGVLYGLLVLAAAGNAPAREITTFDVPGGVWTWRISISPAGTVTGRYLEDAPPYQWHGFVRTAH